MPTNLLPLGVPLVTRGVGLQPETLADRLLVKQPHPASKKKIKNYVGRGNSPTSIKEKETHWLKRA
eukprot:685364-Pelagomonas_calceolata.AAC.1